jgi:hypothetical protein
VKLFPALAIVALAALAGATALRRGAGRAGRRGAAGVGVQVQGPGVPTTAAPADEARRTVAALAGRHDPGATAELVSAYATLARVPGAEEARKEVVHDLLTHPSLTVGLQALLAAVAADPTARRQDPMWPHLVRSVGAVWDAVTVAHGRDLLFLETRPKPRDLLLESLTEIAPRSLTDEQRAGLVSDLIDLYPSLTAEQRPAVDRALIALGSSDLVEILGRRGLGDGSSLKAALEEQRALEASRRALNVR